MASLFVAPHASSLLLVPKRTHLHFFSISQPNLLHPSPPSSLSFTATRNKLPTLRLYSSLPGGTNSPDSDSDPIASSFKASSEEISNPSGIPDEWGEKTEPEPQVEVSISVDPPINEDEWGTGTEEIGLGGGNGSAVSSSNVAEEVSVGDDDDGESERIEGLKRCLVDTVYGMNFGLDASVEVRGEVLELVNQLEASNPTPAPTGATELLDGNWVLVYTAFSELLPLLAASKIPLLKVEKICQSIDTPSLNIDNTVTLSSPFATFSFSASASFEVRSASRIQVVFKEGTFKPPVITSSIKLPENVEVFGQTISLSPVQQSLDPLQGIVANISGIISGQPPFKVPIPGERSQSWLLTTFLDGDLRISRGDGGLFVLAKEGSPLLDQLFG